jgi:hypothetical protein
MHELNLAVYEHLEQVFGYTGSADFVGFHWEPWGDEFRYYDGTWGADASPWGYLAWSHHPSVQPTLERYQLGSSEFSPEHWLILDRKARKLFVDKAKEAKEFLNQQTSPLKQMLAVMPVEDAQKALEEAFRKSMRMGAKAAEQNDFTRKIQAEMAEEQRQLNLFNVWLDQQGRANAN